MALDVNKVRTTVDAIFKKNQIGGYLRTDDFNRLAEKVQYIWFDNKRRKFEETFIVSGDLSPLLTSSTLNLTLSGGNMQVSSPTDFWQEVSATTKSYFKRRGVQEVRDVAFTWVTDAEYDTLIGGDAFRPDNDHPIIKESGGTITVFPSNIQDITLLYIKKPTTPEWVGTVTNNREVYSSGSSTQFEVPEYAFTDIVSLMLRELGVSTRDVELSQYGQATAFTDGNK